MTKGIIIGTVIGAGLMLLAQKLLAPKVQSFNSEKQLDTNYSGFAADCIKVQSDITRLQAKLKKPGLSPSQMNTTLKHIAALQLRIAECSNISKCTELQKKKNDLIKAKKSAKSKKGNSKFIQAQIDYINDLLIKECGLRQTITALPKQPK